MADNDRHEGTFEVSDSMEVDGTPVKLVYTRIRDPREPLGDDELAIHALNVSLQAKTQWAGKEETPEDIAENVLKGADKFYEWLKNKKG